METKICEIGTIDDKKLEFAVICSVYRNQWIFVKHKERNTWEMPGGHRDQNEDIHRTAERELYEETGAYKFTLKPLFDYSVKAGEVIRSGRMFLSEVEALGELPNFEIEKIGSFHGFPKDLTYPQIYKKLFNEILKYKSLNHN